MTIVAAGWTVIPRAIVTRAGSYYDRLVINRRRWSLVVNRLWRVDRLWLDIHCPGLRSYGATDNSTNHRAYRKTRTPAAATMG
jgi:hypothetical protein